MNNYQKILIKRIINKEKSAEWAIDFLHAPNISELSNQITAGVSKLFQCPICVLLLLEKDYLMIKSVTGLSSKKIKIKKIPVGKSLSGRLIKRGQPRLISDLSNTFITLQDNIETYYTGSMLSTPLVFDKQIIGLINLCQTNMDKAFSKEELDRLITFSNQIAFNVKSQQLVDERTFELKKAQIQLQKINSHLEREICERKGTEEKLKKAYKELTMVQDKLVQSKKLAAIGQMAASVSHEIKNPLSGIKLSTYYLTTKIKKFSPKITTTIKNIEKEIAYISKIITNILNYSQLIKLELKLADINEIIEETISTFKQRNLFKNIKVVKEFDLSIPKFLIDRTRFNQVISNLILNACQAMSDKGSLVVKTGISNNKVKVEIIDNGVGIEKNNLNKIFEPFFTTKHRGIGLGLSIVREIVNSHQGSIKIESKLGKGSKFVINLPIKK